MQYPEILFNQSHAEPSAYAPRVPLQEIMQEAGCHGTILIFSDTETETTGAVVVGSDELPAAYDSYDNVILDLCRPETFSDTESVFQQIFTFLSKVRIGGRVLIPQSTYCHLPYGDIGMEILLRARGLQIEAPLAGKGKMIIASVCDL
jgi:hypothetical protein